MTNEEFLKHLRDALFDLYEPDYLRQNPLAGLFGVANRLDTFFALQKILLDTIEDLKPQDDEEPQSPAWETYELLFNRYIQHLTQEYVARQLGMSVRHLRRKEHAALGVLAANLWKQFNLENKLHTGVEQQINVEENEGQNNAILNEELAWLKNTPPDRPTDLYQVLPGVIELANPLAEQYNVDLEVSIDERLPSLAVHAVALTQALFNLLSVAIHQASDRRITVHTGLREIEVEIQVESRSSRDELRPLSTNDQTLLQMANQLTDLCGGRLVVTNNRGVFQATMALPALQQLPVLVIDDNPGTLQLLHRYVSGTRYQLITTQNPTQVLELVEKHAPRLIVLDVMMPGVDGWRVLAQLRHNNLTAHIPVVICTIIAQEEMALSLGANGFVRKPLTRQAFLSALDQQVGYLGLESG
jgi:CheY-like chemotaxis protein/transcriptional regulator with XRE-family HTH domain